MTGAAMLVGNRFLIGHVKRLMHRMAGNTVGKDLTLSMGLVALHAVRNVAVFVMVADRTVKAAVGAGVVPYLTDLVAVAGIADGHIVLAKDNTQGLMGILMTAEAVVHLEMGLALVTHGTLRNHRAFFNSRRMLGRMAVKATDSGQMLAAVFLILMNDFGVAFYTITVFQRCVAGPAVSRGNCESGGQEKGCRDNEISHNIPLEKTRYVFKI